MNRNLSSGLSLAATATLAATLVVAIVRDVRAGDLAGDIGVEPARFTSSRTHQDVVQEMLDASGRVPATTEWSLQQEPPHTASQGTLRESRSEYIAHRREVAAMNAEDSGSAYLWKFRVPSAGAATLGGPAR